MSDSGLSETGLSVLHTVNHPWLATQLLEQLQITKEVEEGGEEVRDWGRGGEGAGGGI